MAKSEIFPWMLGDFNKTYGNNGIPFEKETISSHMLTREDRELVQRELPDTFVWQFARPINPQLGYISTQPPPIDTWVDLAPYLGLNDNTLDTIIHQYKIEEQYSASEPWFIKAGWRALAFSHSLKYISPYRIGAPEYQGLRSLRKQGGNFSFVTALLEHNETDFISHLNNPDKHDVIIADNLTTWEAIQGTDIPIWMRKGRWIDSESINRYKSLVYKTMLEYIKGINKENYNFGFSEQFLGVGWDDDINFALTAVALFHHDYGLKIHMPQSFGNALHSLTTEQLEFYTHWIGRSIWDIFADANPQDEATEARFGDDPLIICSSGPAHIAQKMAA